MCVMCDGLSPEELVDTQRQGIERHGFTMQSVEADDDHPAWLYTIGLVEHHHPELAVMGMPLLIAGEIVGELARAVVGGAELMAGDTVEMLDVAGTGEPLDIHLVDVDDRLWEGPMFSGWYRYYHWLGHPMPGPEALELVPCGSRSVVTPLATVRPHRADHHRAARFRPLSA
jgi:uncharacterized protein DUF4262